ADLDGDGDMDIAVGSSGAAGFFSFLQILKNDGKGVFGSPTGFPLNSKLSFLVAGDLDGNGTPDLVTSGTCGQLCTAPRGISLLFNQTRFPTSRDVNENSIPDECEGAIFHRGDPNGDGKLDVLDALFLVGFLFGGGVASACRESADAQNDGRT